MKAVDVNITLNEIVACYCLGKKKKVIIVRVFNRKHCLKSLRNKKKAKCIDKNAVGIPNAKLFVKENLTPVNSKSTFNCQSLKKDIEVDKHYTINGIVHIVKILNYRNYII